MKNPFKGIMPHLHDRLMGRPLSASRKFMNNLHGSARAVNLSLYGNSFADLVQTEFNAAKIPDAQTKQVLGGYVQLEKGATRPSGMDEYLVHITERGTRGRQTTSYRIIL
tara:strand:- start:7657 stop:7986 length:330 start_codon:yes stop_codon:yes gene_type:complete